MEGAINMIKSSNNKQISKCELRGKKTYDQEMSTTHLHRFSANRRSLWEFSIHQGFDHYLQSRTVIMRELL